MKQSRFLSQLGLTILSGVLSGVAALNGSTLATASDSIDYQHEISLNSTAGFVRINLVTANHIQYAFSTSYSYSLTRMLQLGAQGAVYQSGAPVDGFRYSFYIPLTVNWGGDNLGNDFFAKVAPGISYQNALNTALLLQVGKRFNLFKNVSWKPLVGIAAQFGNGDPRTAIDIVPLSFSILF